VLPISFRIAGRDTTNRKPSQVDLQDSSVRERGVEISRERTQGTIQELRIGPALCIIISSLSLKRDVLLSW